MACSRQADGTGGQGGQILFWGSECLRLCCVDAKCGLLLGFVYPPACMDIRGRTGQLMDLLPDLHSWMVLGSYSSSTQQHYPCLCGKTSCPLRPWYMKSTLCQQLVARYSRVTCMGTADYIFHLC